MKDFFIYNYWGNFLTFLIGIYLLYTAIFKTEQIRNRNSPFQPLMSSIVGGLACIIWAIYLVYMNLFDKW